MKRLLTVVALALIMCQGMMAQLKELGFQESLTWEKMNAVPAPLKQIGTVEVVKPDGTGNSLWSVGCETIERGFTVYDEYKPFVGKLGVGYARLMSGWAKCEPEQGVYDFGWLDAIVDDMISSGESLIDVAVQLKEKGAKRVAIADLSRDDMAEAVRKVNPLMEKKYSLLEKYIYIQPHFTVQEVTDKVDGILVSFRAGKKVTTPAKRAIYRKGKRINVQDGLLVPRGALTEETVYGKLGNKYVVKYPLTHPSMKVDDIVDPTIREIVRTRLAAFGGKAKDAFAKPLYSDAAQTMEIKTVRCYTGLQDKAVASVRFNAQGEPIGFAKTGNNHHIAIYQDAKGQYQESVVSFWQAVERKRYGLPIVIEDPKAIWDKLLDSDLPQEFLSTLPQDDGQFVVSLQANEIFILGMEDGDFEMAMQNKDYQLLNKYLYRVQKIATKNYAFRHHIETSVDDKYDGVKKELLSKQMKKLKITQSFDALFAQHPHKVRVNLLGEISEV